MTIYLMQTLIVLGFLTVWATIAALSTSMAKGQFVSRDPFSKEI